MRVGLSVLLTLIYSVILTAVDFMIAYFSAFVLGFDVRYLLDTHGLGRLAWILLSKAILILIVITINKIFEKTMIFIKRYVVIMCIYSIFLLILIFVMIELNIGRGSVETELFLTIFFIASIVIELLMFYFVIKTGEGHEQKRQAELIELKNNMLQKSLDETEQAFKLWRSSVHDYKNNIIALRQLVNDGKIKEVSEYLNHESELIDKKMFYIRTGSSVVDTIVNTKQNFAEEKGITFVVNAIIPGKCIISELDMASILGNLIDNAIEACEGENEPYIDVTIRQEKTFIVIKIINKYSREFSNNLKTTKNKKMFHGIGIGSVKSIVEKYEGKFSIEKKGNEVVAKIVMSNF
jgi:sensor histidine kinase YesM